MENNTFKFKLKIYYFEVYVIILVVEEYITIV